MGEPEHLYPAPRNALPPPPGKDRKHGHATRRLVVARLVWPNKTTIVPAVAMWISSDRICVEWETHPGSHQTRMTWLRPEDVRPRLTYPS